MKEIENFKDIRLEMQRPTIGPDILENLRKQNEEVARYAEEAYQEKLRRHNELIDSIKEAGKQGATIIVGDNAGEIQIQQNSAGASQTLVRSQIFNYEQAAAILREIVGFFDYPQFDQAFGERAEATKVLVLNTLKSVSEKENESLVKKSLRILRDLAIGATGSVIGAGIYALIAQLPLG